MGAGLSARHTQVRRPPDLFVGRGRELDALADALERVGSGTPALAIVEGSPGIGKSTLVSRFLAMHADVRSIRASADDAETSVPFGVVDQVFRRAHTGSGLLEAEVPAQPDQLVVGLRLLELLEVDQRSGPLILVVDDAHAADSESVRAVHFALRRLVAHAVLVVFVTRDAERLPEGLLRMAPGHRISVPGLHTNEVKALAAAHGAELTTRGADRLRAHTAGNPLYMEAVLRQIDPLDLVAPQRRLPAPASLAESIQQQLTALSAPARALVEVASVLGASCRIADATALARLASPLPAIDDAVAAGLIRVEAGTIRFAHPLIADSIRERLRPARAVLLHTEAAERADDPLQALRHRVDAAIAPDAELSRDLEAAADGRARLEDWVAGAELLLNASRLSPDEEDAERLLLEAVVAMGAAGDAAGAARLIDGSNLKPGAMRDFALGNLALLRGDLRRAEQQLLAAWTGCDVRADARLAGRTALAVSLLSSLRLRAGEQAAWARRATELLERGDPARVHALCALASAHTLAGPLEQGRRLLEDAIAEADPTTLNRLPLRSCRGWLRWIADDLGGALADLRAAAPAALEAGSRRNAAVAFARLAVVGFDCGLWDQAAVDAERAVAIALESEDHSLLVTALGAATLVPVARGRVGDAEGHLRALEDWRSDGELHVFTAAVARAHAAATSGDHVAVLQVMQPLLRIVRRDGVDGPGPWPWQHLYGGALVEMKRIDEADAFLRRHATMAREQGRTLMQVRLERVRGSLELRRGDSRLAERTLEDALARMEQLSAPYERALVELALGQVRRRAGRRRAAAAVLGDARVRLGALGARPALDRCERELEACGVRADVRAASLPDGVTAQERSVAGLVAAGMTNREVAVELIVSTKTVEHHLTRAYAKLGVRSRAELRAQVRRGQLDLA
jgi:DNA-binding CsgD family transcriptional regulator